MIACHTKPWTELTAADLMTAGVVGVFSRTDVARRLAHQGPSAADGVRSCRFQDTLRDRVGQPVILCELETGRCLLQREGGPLADSPSSLRCALPHQVAADWQVVEGVTPPADEVRHHVTAVPVVAHRETPLFDLARLMSDEGVHRVIVIDDDRRPVGVVSSMDVARAVAECPSDCSRDGAESLGNGP